MKLIKTLRADYAQFCRLNHKEPKHKALPMFLHPRLIPVANIRLASFFNHLGLRPIGSLFSLWNTLVFKVEVPARAEIGSGLVLPHPFGIVLGSAKIGENVTIFQNVTLGARSFDGAYDLTTRPTLKDKVIVGCGGVVLGAVTVGEGAIVAANSLVTRDIEPNTTAMGVPSHEA